MSARAVLALVAAVLASGSPAAAQEPSDPVPDGAAAPRVARPADPRSTVVLRYDCASEVGRREVTLFANGTIRLWDGPPEEQEMVLAELAPEELDGYLARLEEEDLPEEPDAYHGVEGSWVERCVLELPLREGRDRHRFELNRYDRLSLGLSRLVRIAEEIGAVADERRGAGLDERYRPRPGDVLERPDGARFRVVDFTIDGRGVEVEGVELPLTLYLAPDAFAEVFSRLVERRDDPP